MITPKNLVKHELIGLKVKVVDSKNPTSRGLTGNVVDETRNVIKIEKDNRKEVKLIKDQCTFSFMVNGRWIDVDGKLLVARPEDRVKKKFKKW